MKQHFNFGYFIAEGFKSIFTHGLMSFAAVCMIVCCLLIMGSFSLVALNMEQALEEFEDKNVILAYVDENLDPDAIRALQPQLEAIPNVNWVEFTAKETAKEDYVARYAESSNAELFRELPDEVFRDRYAIHIENIEQAKATVEAIRGVSGVAKANLDEDLSEGMVKIRNVAGGVAGILVVILLAVSLFIIANTIRLAFFNRREEIAIMKMCGATNGFIRWPFVFEGLLLGVFGAVTAFFLEWGVYTLVHRAVEGEGGLSLLNLLPYQELALPVLGVFVTAGLLIGVVGSALAIRKFLKV